MCIRFRFSVFDLCRNRIELKGQLLFRYIDFIIIIIIIIIILIIIIVIIIIVIIIIIIIIIINLFKVDDKKNLQAVNLLQ